MSWTGSTQDRLRHNLLVRREQLRRMARRDVLAFTRYTLPMYIADPAHAVIAWTLNQAIRGKHDRIMIFAPPQHGKSELASVRFPAFWLGCRPDDPVIITSYGADLALDKSQQARAVVESEEYADVFPQVKTDPTSRAKELWRLRYGKRGTVKAAGVGGPVTGRGAMLGIIDDPVKDWSEAKSQVIRTGVYDWYRSTFRTRIWQNGVIALIMTRWDEEDLAGQLLRDQPGRWYVLRMPALAETQEERDHNHERMGLPTGQIDPLGRQPGEPLCPTRFPIEVLEEIRDDVGSIVWGAEYQASPSRPEGDWFMRAWFDIVPPTAVPEDVSLVRYWDQAATQGGGAHTAGVLMGVRFLDSRKLRKEVYIIDVVHGQWSSSNRMQVMLQTAQIDREMYGGRVKVWFEQEPGSAGVDAAEDVKGVLDEFPVYADKVTGDKDVRLTPFHAAAEGKRVHLVSGHWNRAWVDELCTLQAGVKGQKRDQADATGGAYSKLAGKRWRRMGFAHLGQTSEQEDDDDEID